MKKTLFLSAVSLTMASVAAQAGGYTAPVTEAPVAVAPPVVEPARVDGDWTGFYAGANFSHYDGKLKYSGNAIPDKDVTGNGYGLHAGYLHDFGQWVGGAELSYEKLSKLKLEGTDEKKDGDMTRAKLMAGYDGGRILPYVALGAAHASIDKAAANGDNISGSGWFAGIGAKFKATDNILIGAEIDKNQFKDFGGDGDKWDPTTIGLSVSYKF